MITMEPYEETFTRSWLDVEIWLVPLREWNLHTLLSTTEINILMALVKRRNVRWCTDREHATPPS